MSNRPLLRTNVGVPDGSLFSQGLLNSFFKPEAWQTFSDKIRETQRVLQTQNLVLGQDIGVEYEKVGTLLEDIRLDITLAPIVGQGVGTYARACDYLGLALVPQIEVIYQSNVVQRYNSQALYIKNLRDHDIIRSDIFDQELAGGLTEAERNTRATANQKVRVYLKPYWYGNKGHCPIITALANKIRMNIKLANVQDFVQTDFTLGATTSIVSAEWNHEIINTTGYERDEWSRQVFTPKGLSYLMEDTHSLLYSQIPAGSTEATIDLKGFVLPFTSGYGLLQKTTDINTPFQKKLFQPLITDFNLITEARLQDGTTANFPDVSKSSMDFADRWQKKHCQARWRKPIIFFGMSEIVDIKNINLGSFDAAMCNTLQIYLKFSVPLPVDYSLTFILFEHNFVNHQGGELQKIFH